MENNPAYFAAGGIIVNDLLYIQRQGDDMILDCIKNSSDLICVFEPNQSGKTSLYHQIPKSLQKTHDIELVYINLNSMGTYDVSEIKWFFGVAFEVYQKLDLPVEVLKLLHKEYRENPPQFWRKFIESLSKQKNKIVIFFDDFNVVDLFDFNFNNFFAPLADSLGNVLFVLMGVIPRHMVEAKSECFKELKKTFIPLRDFKEVEMKDFKRALRTFQDSDREIVIKEIYKWTNGHPYFSQKIGEKLSPRAAVGQVNVLPDISEIVSNLFFNGISSDLNLATCNIVFNRLFPVDDKKRGDAALSIYELLLNESEPMPKEVLAGKFADWSEQLDEILEDLRYTNLISISKEAEIECRNKIYREAFNHQWIEQKRQTFKGYAA
jgi:hypothetical protein